jgi:oligopeptide transport system substrate-binding protein
MLTSKFILPNLTVKPLDDVRVREAIALALNRADMCAVIGRDYIPSANYVAEFMLSTSTGKYFKDEQDPLFTEDILKAKQLLADAGYADGANFPALTYTYPNSDKDSLMAQAIKAQLKANLGIEITLNGEESQVYAQDKKDGNYQLIRHSWTADFNDPINYLNLYVTGSSSNYNGTANGDFDAAIAASDAASDPAVRNQALHDAQNILVRDNFYVIPCVTQVYYCLKNKNISNITFNDKGEPLYRFASIGQ